jgi:N-acetylneuraminic acid mutarotase
MKTLEKILFPALVLSLGSTLFACATANEEDPTVTPADTGAAGDTSTPVTDSGAPMDGTTSDTGGSTVMDSGAAMDAPADAASCIYPKTETRACGACGSQSRFCLPENVFTGWTDCVGEKGDTECKVGEKRFTECGNCGKATDFCDPKECVWIGGLCAGEGPCAPGDEETTKASCSVADTVRTRTCDDKCQWGEFSSCDLPRGWFPMDPAPIAGRGFHTAVWTGTDMLVWGGGYSSTVKNDGASYNYATNKWTTIATPTLAARRQQAGVWTGSKMIVWGGYNGGSSYADGGVYDPATDSWTSTATSPLAARHSGAYAWSTTTNELLLWSGCTGGWCTAVASDGAAYNPSTNTWTTLPAAPIAGRSDPAFVWSGSELVVWGGRTATGTFLTDGARFDPVTRVWTKFSEPPASIAGRMDEAFGSSGTNGLFVFGGRPSSSTGTGALDTGATYVPSVGWQVIPSPPDTVFANNKRYDSASFVAGGKLFLFDGLTSTGGDTPARGFASYDFATGTWTDLDVSGAPTSNRARATAVWTGREAIIWGGINGNTCCTGYATGAIYRP